MKRAMATVTTTVAVLAGLIAVGCGSKDQTQAAATPTHDAPSPALGPTVTPAPVTRP